MTQIYKKNGAVFIPAGITVEEVEKLKELLNRSNIRLAEEQIKNAQNKKEVEQEIVEEDVYFNPYQVMYGKSIACLETNRKTFF